MIEFSKVSKKYGPKTAVQGLDLTVPSGELFALLGPNGAGKTTTIKMLTTLLRPTTGTIRICGINVASDPREAVKHLGYVPDEPYLYEKLSGREFLQFIVDMYGIDPAEGKQRIEREIENFELAPFVEDLAETYSHGMKQRLVFASALLHEPKVLVIDEPMVGLDPRSARLAKDLLKSRAAEGMTIFMSTHTLAVAEEIADRIGIVDHGRLLCVGTMPELQHSQQLHDSSLEKLFLEVTAAAEEAGPPLNETVPGNGIPS